MAFNRLTGRAGFANMFSFAWPVRFKSDVPSMHKNKQIINLCAVSVDKTLTESKIAGPVNEQQTAFWHRNDRLLQPEHGKQHGWVD